MGSLTEFAKVRREPDKGLRLDERLGDAESDCEPVARAGAAAQLVDDDKAVLANVPVTSQLVDGASCWTHWSMKAVSRISAAKVETLASMQSSMDTRAKSRSTMEKDAYCAGTKLPICAITVIRAIERMYVLFPLMLHPVMIWNRFCLSAYTSFGTYLCECAYHGQYELYELGTITFS